ncbi:heterokaryon incompatibility protein-domain-containing protein [Penicillium cosmopolitanum]|uniref:Heterokaryon incompatibility protein-domain-containing protein n=1 Tax=Penicillium cosmopolitanum TaxID=1131564 RepID=A0A9W9SEF7_9EURO|nr:heterokaryon incompatibility protein-domain-containing protein [Penicillium cosmopolitanum]KAJ5376515.1 heterokaryon incompatibility protein-domain-containing protein [Penicillium cosmopolitanum]
MRLIHTHSLELWEFADNEVPEKYAILSHRWEKKEEEISFQEMLHANDVTRHKIGYRKIESFCENARDDGFDFAWVDTCCINKDSSAELSEAINSMFRWYQQAKKCYAYLADVHTIEQLSSSKWFERGWTLQEFLAPSKIHFFSDDWTMLGKKKTLIDTLVKITRIPHKVLSQPIYLNEVCIAKKMSRVSQRKTTRPEDMAYCLMGIFNINMPLLYGEGGVKSFLRLQEEIIKTSSDTTIFAWVDSNPSRHADLYEPHGLLATSVQHFAESHDIFQTSEFEEPYSMTNRGLRIELPIFNVSVDMRRYAVAKLFCSRKHEFEKVDIGVYLARLDDKRFCRIIVDRFSNLYGKENSKSPQSPLTLFIPQRLSLDEQAKARLQATTPKYYDPLQN